MAKVRVNYKVESFLRHSVEWPTSRVGNKISLTTMWGPAIIIVSVVRLSVCLSTNLHYDRHKTDCKRFYTSASATPFYNYKYVHN